jgi:RNA-binding protein 42
MSVNQGKGWTLPTLTQNKSKLSAGTLGIAAPAKRVMKKVAEKDVSSVEVHPKMETVMREESKRVSKLDTSLLTATIPTQERTERMTSTNESVAEDKSKRMFRAVGGEVWEDPSLRDWNPNDFRLFVGNLGNEVTDTTLHDIFSVYPTFDRARVVRDKNGKTKGFGFVSFLEANDFLKALKEWNGQYIGNRPCMLKRSTWEERSVKESKKVKYSRK